MRKLLRKTFITVFPITLLFVILAAGMIYFRFLEPLKRVPEERPPRKVLKIFDFSSRSDLDLWEEKALAPGKTTYELLESEGEKYVKAVSEDSASALFFKDRISHEGDPYLSWEWKPEKFPGKNKKETLTDKEEFDFAAQVYVVFYATFYLNAEAIQYVWAEELPEGTVADSPYTGKVKLMVLESGPSDKWKHETRDIKADYQRLFGKKLTKDIMAISFMTDADSTGTQAVAYFDNIEIGNLNKPDSDGAGPVSGDREEDPDGRKRGTEISVKTDRNSEQ